MFRSSNVRRITLASSIIAVIACIAVHSAQASASVRPLVLRQAAQQNLAIRSGSVLLSFQESAAGYGIRIHDLQGGSVDAVSAAPASVSVCAPSATAGQCATPTSVLAPQPELSRPYDRISTTSTNSGTAIVAAATIASPAGSVFIITDEYQPGAAPDTFTITRGVSIGKVGSSDAGFNTEYAIGFDPLQTAAASSIEDYHFFAPGIWYDKNTFAAPHGLAGNFRNRNSFFWRETRSGLPIVMMQDPMTGTALTLAHSAPAPTPGAAEVVTSAQWLIANSLYGSVGVSKNTAVQSGRPVDRPTLGFYYPSQEGDVNYTTPATSGWVRRSNPMRQPNGSATTQHYTLTLSLQRYRSNVATGMDRAAFADAMTGTWRLYYDSFNPEPVHVALESVFNAGIQILEKNYASYPYQGLATSSGFPLSIDPFTGEGPQSPVTFEMGFVGQELPLAFQLFRHGLRTGDATAKTDGEQILNFWSTQEPSAEKTPGLPLTSYLVRGGPGQSGFTPGFATSCNSVIYLRALEEGMEGVVAAALAAREGPQPQPQPAWEQFANGFGAWLLAHQNKDGSFYRAFTPAGHVFEPPTYGCEPKNTIVDGTSKLSTAFPIRYLVMMYVATGNPSYKNAAELAGYWSLSHIYGPMSFVGGVENYNYLDRSSAIEAMNAALALHDMELLGGNTNAAGIWAQAAQRAANYAETWMYAYDFPIRDLTQEYEGKPAGRYSDYVRAGTRATSIIVTGASQSDIDLSIATFDYFRLYVLGGGADQHELGLAQLLEYNTKLTTQLPAAATTLDQQFGYAYNGLVTEAIGLANMGFSTQEPYVGYLAWLTNAELDPASRFQDVFGDFDIATITSKNGLSRLETENSRIYPAPGSLGWTAQ